jgi:hypothetical protein
MRIVYSVFVLTVVMFLSGCRDEVWYDVKFVNCTNQNIQDGKVIGWKGVVVPAAGTQAGITNPVPDCFVITWKTVKPEKEEYLKKLEEKWQKESNGYLIVDKNSMAPAFPELKQLEGIFDDHKVEVTLKGKVPRRPQGEITIEFHESDRIEVQYVEKKIGKYGVVRPSGRQEDFQGCELTITCKGDVKEVIYVKVKSGKMEENFGGISRGPNGRDSGATIGFGPFKLGEEVVIQWGVDGIDDLKMENSVTFDTRKYLPYRDKIKAVEFIFHGGKNWELKVYDNNISDVNKKEIIP